MSDSNEKKCFIIMPISDPEGYSENHFRRVYDHLIRPACEKANLVPICADDVRKTNYIIIDILRKILDSDVLICDLSSKNPNVLYELGIRQAFNRPVVLIKDRRTERIFDIQGMRTLEYDESLRVDTVQRDVDNLKKTLIETSECNEDDVNSLIQILGIPQAEINSSRDISPETSLVLDSLKDISQRITKLEEVHTHESRFSINKSKRYWKLPNGETVQAGDTIYDALGNIFGDFICVKKDGVIIKGPEGEEFVIPPDDENYMHLSVLPF